MKLLYGTTNQAKLKHMKEMLEGLNIELLGLKDVGVYLDVDENGNIPLENARIKAIAYYRATGIPTFSCDSGLFIEGLKENRQPGVHVRGANGRYMNDEEFIQYYSNLVSEIGEDLRAKFKNAICLVLDEKRIYEYDGDDISDNFLITSRPHKERKEGFPMDSISIDIDTGKYFIEIERASKNEEGQTRGVRQFFQRSILTKE